MPIIIIWKGRLIEPYRARRCLAHLATVRRGDERGGQAEHLRPVDPPGQFNAVDDIAPLIRSAHLQPAGVAARQFKEIIGLEDHIVEFEEGQRLFPVQPQLHRIKGEHPVDRKVLANIAQERNIFQRIKPIGIVDHHRVRGAIAKGQKAFKHCPDAGDIGVDVIIGQQFPAFILARGIADLGGAAAHHHNRFMPRLLQPAQHHDLHHRTDMERGRGRIKPDIAGHDAAPRQRIKRACVSDLMDIAPRLEKL